MRIVTTAVVIAMLSFTLSAQEPSEPDTAAEAERGIVPIPVLGYSPETGFLVGGAAIYFSTPAGSDDPVETTNLAVNLLYGTAGFFNVGFSAQAPVSEDRLYFDGSVGVSRARQQYFGLGLQNDGSEDYTQFQIGTNAALFYRATPTFRVGPSYRISYVNVIETEDDGRLVGGTLEGSDSALVSAPGVRAAYDTRDSGFFPRSGVYIGADTSLSAEWLGASSTFGLTTLDGRAYHEVFPRGVLAGQVRIAAAYGETPFQFLPVLGGQNELRGFLQGEIRDNVTLLAQGDFRFPIVWRFSGAAFFGVGTAGTDLGSILWDQLQPAGGAGIRFAINPDQGVALRLDVAHNGREFAVYFGFGEAF